MTRTTDPFPPAEQEPLLIVISGPSGVGKDVIMRIDVQGAARIREICPGALLIFVTTQNEEEMVQRFKQRKAETPEGLKLRIATARQELKRLGEFDYVVVNREERLDEAVDTILAIIRAEHHRVNHRKGS